MVVVVVEEAVQDWDWEEAEEPGVAHEEGSDDIEHDPNSSDWEGTESERDAAIAERRCEKHGSDYCDLCHDPYSSDWEGTESERDAAIAENRCEKHGRDHCDRCQMEAWEELENPEDLPLVRAAASGSLALTRHLVEAGVRSGDKRGKVVNMSRRLCESEQKWGYTKEWEWNGDTPLIAACREGHAEVVRYLLLNGADPTLASGEEGLSAAEAARCCAMTKALVLAALPFWRRAPYAGQSDQRGKTGICSLHCSMTCKRPKCQRDFRIVKFSNAPTDKKALCAAVAAVQTPMELRADSHLGQRVSTQGIKVSTGNVCQLNQSKCDGCKRVFGSAQGLACHLKDSTKCPRSSRYQGRHFASLRVASLPAVASSTPAVGGKGGPAAAPHSPAVAHDQQEVMIPGTCPSRAACFATPMFAAIRCVCTLRHAFVPIRV